MCSILSKDIFMQKIPASAFLHKRVYFYIAEIRYWHYYNGEDSAKIYKQAPVEMMKRNYMIFHTMDLVLAIEDLKEIHNQKKLIKRL